MSCQIPLYCTCVSSADADLLSLTHYPFADIILFCKVAFQMTVLSDLRGGNQACSKERFIAATGWKKSVCVSEDFDILQWKWLVITQIVEILGARNHTWEIQCFWSFSVWLLLSQAHNLTESNWGISVGAGPAEIHIPQILIPMSLVIGRLLPHSSLSS